MKQVIYAGGGRVGEAAGVWRLPIYPEFEESSNVEKVYGAGRVSEQKYPPRGSPGSGPACRIQRAEGLRGGSYGLEWRGLCSSLN